jgi:hypothetical protein
MILRRIYFYRKSAIEIFTTNKSYYFNFFENPLLENNQDKMAETNSHNLISLLANSFNDDLVPVDIKNQVIGYSREFNYEVQDIILQNNQNNINIKNKEKDKDKEKDKNNKDEILNDGNKFIDNLLKRWINENYDNPVLNTLAIMYGDNPTVYGEVVESFVNNIRDNLLANRSRENSLAIQEELDKESPEKKNEEAI